MLWGEDEEGADEEDDGGHAEDETVEEDGEEGAAEAGGSEHGEGWRGLGGDGEPKAAGGAVDLLAADLPGLEQGAEVREDGGFRQSSVEGDISEGEAAGGLADGLNDGGAAGFCDGAHGVR